MIQISFKNLIKIHFISKLQGIAWNLSLPRPFQFWIFSTVCPQLILSPMQVLKNESYVIWISLKNVSFSEISRAWLKNWAYHALFNLELWNFEIGMEGSIFKPHLCNFFEWCIFDRHSNDIINFFWYFQPKISNLIISIFSTGTYDSPCTFTLYVWD